MGMRELRKINSRYCQKLQIYKDDVSAHLTAKQAKILEFIEETWSITSRAPTYREIASHFGYDAVGTVQDHVRALKQKGFLDQEGKRSARGLKPSHLAEVKSIPLLGSVPAGHPVEAIEDRRGVLAFSPPTGRASKAAPSEDTFALKIRGDSMEGAGILDGDFVIVRRQGDAENGEIVIAMIDGEATCKRLEKRGGRVRLMPENPRYEPIEIPPGLLNCVQGKVLGVQRFY